MNKFLFAFGIFGIFIGLIVLFMGSIFNSFGIDLLNQELLLTESIIGSIIIFLFSGLLLWWSKSKLKPTNLNIGDAL